MRAIGLRHSRCATTVTEVLIAAAAVVIVLMVGLNLIIGGSRLARRNVERLGTVRGSVAVRLQLQRDLSLVVNGNVTITQPDRLVLNQVRAGGVPVQVVYSVLPTHELMRQEGGGPPTRLGTGFRGHFQLERTPDGRLGVTLSGLDVAGVDGAASSVTYADAFTFEVSSRFAPFYRPIHQPAPWH